MKFWIKMFSGLFIGILVGAYLEPTSLFIEPLRIAGSLFFRLLNLAVFPLLLFSAIRCIYFLRTKRRLFVVLIKSIGYYVLLSGIGATIGIVLGDILLPGVGINIQEFASPMKLFYPPTSDFILNTIPESIVEFMRSEYGVLSILFVSFLIAVGIILAKDEAEQFHSLVKSIEHTLHRLNLIVLEFLPIGIFCYVGYTMGYMTAGRLVPYLKLILIIVAGSFIQIFIIQALLVFAMTRMNPFKFIHAVLPAALTGFISGNRYTAYPVLVETIEHNLGADREVFTFAAGLGSAFSFSGSVLAAGVATMFVAQVYGLDLSIYLQIVIILLLTASTLKLDRIRDGSLVILSVLLAHIIKLPAEGYALVLGITSVMYQIESTVNISGTAAVSYILASSEGAVVSVKLKDFF